MSEYRIGKLKGRFVLVFEDRSGKRRRYRLDAKDAGEAHRVAPGIFAELMRPRGSAVFDLWQAYVREKAGHPVLGTMVHTWKALRDRFAAMDGETITVADCRAHVAERRKAGIKDGTLLTELGHLRIVLRWAEKHGLIGRAPFIERPSRPKPKTDYLTKDQARALMGAAIMPHLRLYIVLALTTGARNAALLGLHWNRCDLDRGMIDFHDPEMVTPHKGRAIVPVNRTLRAALQEARAGALSDYVIEWGGKRVSSVKRGLAEASRRAGLPGVAAHASSQCCGPHGRGWSFDVRDQSISRALEYANHRGSLCAVQP